jgi:hypothetical protein
MFCRLRRRNHQKNIYPYFVPNVERKHPWKECPLDNIEICGICEESHATKDCPSLPGIKEIYHGEKGASTSLYVMAPQKPWKPRPSGMAQNLHLNFLILIIRCGMFLCHGNIGHLSPIHNRIGSKVGMVHLMMAQLLFLILHHHHIHTPHRLLNNKLINHNNFHYQLLKTLHDQPKSLPNLSQILIIISQFRSCMELICKPFPHMYHHTCIITGNSPEVWESS